MVYAGIVTRDYVESKRQRLRNEASNFTVTTMSSPIIAKIDVKKINKEWLFAGSKGTYLDAVIYENDNVDQYGNSHVIKQNPPREARDQGAKPVIIGNCRWMPQKGAGQSSPKQPSRNGAVPAAQHPLMQDSGDEIPF